MCKKPASQEIYPFTPLHSEDVDVRSTLELQRAGYLNKLDKCPKCKFVFDGFYRRKAGNQQVYRYCFSCKVWHNVLNQGHIPTFLSRALSPQQVLDATSAYGDGAGRKAASANEVARGMRVSFKPIRRLFDFFRKKEAEAGLKMCNDIVLKGRVEVDCHSPRSFRISPTNPHYQREVQDAWRRFEKTNCKLSPQEYKQKKKDCYYFQLHVRLAGASTRGGQIVLKFMPLKAVPPAGRPPLEANLELEECGIMDQLHKTCQVYPFADGSVPWKSVLQSHGYTVKEVIHKDLEFVRDAPKRGRGDSSLSGTESLDSQWQLLDDYIPHELSNTEKDPVLNRHVASKNIKSYVYSWVWRTNIKRESPFRLFEALGKLCK